MKDPAARIQPLDAAPEEADASLGRTRRLLLAGAFLYLAVMGWSRLHQAVLSWDLLVELGARPGPLYQAVTGGLWGLLGLSAAATAYVRRRWARIAVLAAALAFALTYWLDYLLFTRAAEMMRNWPFALALTLLGLVYAVWAARSAVGMRRN